LAGNADSPQGAQKGGPGLSSHFPNNVNRREGKQPQPPLSSSHIQAGQDSAVPQ
jgi:hypothetical protein